MNIQRQTNTFNKGMNMDLDYSVMDSQQYSYAENIRIITNDNGSTGVMQNIEGVIKTTPTMQITGETIIHVMTIRDWAIVFTKTKDNTNSIYRYDFSKSDEFPTVTKVIDSVDLNLIPTNGIYTISSVGRWESEDNVKIYWCDGNNQIRVLNVDDAHDNSNINANDLNILPNGVLPPVELLGIGSGSLKTGKYQYCYQLFNPRSAETAVSVLSPMFTVIRNSNKTNSKLVTGDDKEDNTGKSIKIGTKLLSTNFTKAKIIRLYYKDNTTVPVITVINDINITNNALWYEDKGGTVISELTVDEFNALTGYNFIPKVIESKDNRLFAANIKESTWDIDDELFDCRAYRCNRNGMVKLTSNSGQDDLEFHIGNIPTGENAIPVDHDCINPYNSLELYTDVLNDYKYTYIDGLLIQGGKGLNISYEFVVTDLIEDDETINSTNALLDNWHLGSESYSFNSLPIYSIRNGVREKVDSVEFTNDSKKIPNYSNPEIESKLQGYHRDEIYRFAIVFYNEQNIASSAHWIADIRMPKSSDNYDFFSSKAKVTLGNTQTESKVLVTHPLGIRFTVQNIPTNLGITGFEIVRCERTIQDRTILTQGIISGLTQHKTNPSMLVPFPYLSFASSHSLISMSDEYRYTWNYSKYQSNEYFRFISPDICVNKENISEVLGLATDLSEVCVLSSQFYPSTGMGQGEKFDKLSWSGSQKYKLFSSASSVKVLKNEYDGDNVTLSAGTIKDVSARNWNRDDGWVYDRVKVSDLDDGESTGELLNAVRIDGSTLSYNAVLAKYYLKTKSTLNPITVENVVYAPSYDPFDLSDDAWKIKGVAIGDKTYYNWCWDVSTTASNEGAGKDTTHNNNMRKAGPHGLCAIIRSKDTSTEGNIKFISINGTAGLKDTIAVRLCNLRQAVTPYGGETFAVRQNSVYISTGNYVELTSNSGTKTCYGGDTYLGVLDYATCMFGYLKDDYKPDSSRNKAYVGAYIPCESSVNLSLRGDDFQVSKTFEPDGYANHLVQNEITQIGNLYTQSKPLYAYNDAYSAQPRSKVFVSKSMYDIDNLHTDTRVISSEVKTNNELSDSWTKFKVANYIDVDTRFGSINNMKLFQNQLLFWQTDAFGTLAVNERSLITDNNIGALTLGTGDILARYDYISLKNGSKENQLRTATQSDSTVYWYDYDRNEICSFGNGLNYVSKLKGVQSYLNDNKSSFTLDPKTVYDKKYNEALFTLEDKTLVYNEQMGAFSSFYTFSPSWWAEFSDKLYAFNSLNCFKYNAGDEADLFTGEDKVSYIQFVVNDGYPQTKTFDNVEYSGDFTHGTNFNDIYFDTKRQRSSSLTDKDIDYREDTYKFCIPRNSLELSEIGKLVNKSYKDRMKGKYLVCHYKYNCNGGNTFEVPYISTAYRPSMI